MDLILITVIQCIYVVYMLRYFKTKYSLTHPLVNMQFNNKYLRHHIGVSEKPISHICEFGKQASILIAGLLLLRLFLILNKSFSKKLIKSLSKMAIFLIFIVSLMNMNAVFYLLPFFASEFYIIRNKI